MLLVPPNLPVHSLEGQYDFKLFCWVWVFGEFEYCAEALYRTIKEIETPRSGVTSAERRAVFTLLYRQIKEDNDLALRFAKKLEGHRKLIRYEQRAVNQIRKAAQIKK